MLDFFLSILGLSQSSMQRAEERKLRAMSLLAQIDTISMETYLQLDFEIQRLGLLAEQSAVPPEMAVASLITMRGQCQELKDLVETNRSMVKVKGVNAATLSQLEQWFGTCSAMPTQVRLGIQQIELAIANGVGCKKIVSSSVQPTINSG